MLRLLIAGLDGRLLTPFSLWLGAIEARLTRESGTNIDLGTQDLSYFPWTLVVVFFSLRELNAEQFDFEEVVFSSAKDFKKK